jgi:RND family efflux transporter MFP subunit
VSGKAVYVNPLLKKGQRITKGTLLLEIDPTEFKLTVAEAEANLRSIDAQNAQLNDKEISNQELLKLEFHTLELKQKELDRQQTLASTNITTKSDYDQAETTYIAQKYKVQALKNTINSLVTEHELLKAQKEQAALKLQSAQLQLKYTKIIAPFDCLISSVNVENSQFIQKGQTVAEADNVDSVEIEAQLANGLYVFRPLENEDLREKIMQDNVKLGEVFGISAIVRSVSGKIPSEWKGDVMRFNVEIDTKTRTPGIIVQVNDPYSLNSDQPRRPLIKGMYCEVELFGRPFRDQIIIPRTALHEGNTVYVVDENDKIHFRKVETGFSQDSFTMIRSGLAKGEKVVLTDLVPAVEGMVVIPMIDKERAEKIINEARGGKQ